MPGGPENLEEYGFLLVWPSSHLTSTRSPAIIIGRIGLPGPNFNLIFMYPLPTVSFNTKYPEALRTKKKCNFWEQYILFKLRQSLEEPGSQFVQCTSSSKSCSLVYFIFFYPPSFIDHAALQSNRISSCMFN